MKIRGIILIIAAVLMTSVPVIAGPYPQHGVTPDVAKYWASEVIGYNNYLLPQNILGAVDGQWAVGSPAEGWITVRFDKPITNGPGYDFAVWENGFKLSSGRIYAELGYVDVSSDGQNWVTFPSVYLDAQSGTPYVDPTNVYNLAGNYEANYIPIEKREGTPFDLDDILNTDAVINGIVDPNNIVYVRLRDILGAGEGGSNYDYATYFGYPEDHLIYDGPSYHGGADWDAIGVINAVPIPAAVWLLGSGLVGLIGIRRKII